jgi:hypothetical protein
LLLAFVLILAATALFLVTRWPADCSVASPARRRFIRVIFTWIERKVEGDHLARLKLDQGPMDQPQAAAEGNQAWPVAPCSRRGRRLPSSAISHPIRELLPDHLPNWRSRPLGRPSG